MRRSALVVFIICTLACGRPAAHQPLEVFSRLPDFTLTAVGPKTERPFRLNDLKGRIWVADFIFTSCAGPCPLMSERMSRLLQDLPPSIGLMTISVDPDRDDAPRLRAYARRYNSDLERWIFLRGEISEIYQLLYAGFRLAVSTDPKAPIEQRVTHSTRFVLIDATGVVRGYYDGLSDEGTQALKRDVLKLMEANS